MNKIRILLLALFVFLTNCNRNEGNLLIVEKFPEEEKLIGHAIKDITFFTKSNVNMVVVDTFLAIQKREESIINIFSTSDYKPLAAFGKNGNGPNEFVFPTLLKQTSYDESNNSPVICVYDIVRRRFSEINVLNAVDKHTGKIFNELPLPDNGKFFTYFSYRDNNLMVTSIENGPRLVIFKDSTKSYQEISYLPSLSFDVRKEFETFKNHSSSLVNKKLGRIVSAPFFFGEIDFFDLNGKLISSTVFETQDNLKKSLTNTDEKGQWNPKYYIIDMQASDQHIYALNYDNYQNDYVFYNNKCTSQSILVFDWNGNPVKKYLLDTTYFIRYFAVDLKNKRFYGFCLEESDYPIIGYNF